MCAFFDADTAPAYAQALWSIRDYVTNTGGGVGGQHVALAGWFWWCWNANSGDTGGQVRLKGFLDSGLWIRLLLVSAHRVRTKGGLGKEPWGRSVRIPVRLA